MKRSLYLDNLKFILIFFVVLGHFAHLNREIPIFGLINNIIYSFHMPLFIFVSGYLSKNIVQQRKEEVYRILYIYIVFEVLNIVFSKLTLIGCGSTSIFYPSCQNWYILGIFFWRLFLPYFNLFQKKISLITAVILAFVIGFYEEFNTFLGLYRIIYFMPFFVLGSYCNDINLFKHKYIRFRYLFFTILFLSFTTIIVLSINGRDLNYAIAYAFTPSKGYASLSFNLLFLRFGLRIIGFVTSIVISFCFLFLVPNKKTFFSHYGRYTLNVYVLHMFFVWPINWLFEHFNLPVLLMFLFSIFISVLLTIFLSSDLVNNIILPFTNGQKMLSMIMALFKRDAHFVKNNFPERKAFHEFSKDLTASRQGIQR